MKNLKLLIFLYLLLISGSLSAQEFKTKSGDVQFLSKAALNEFTGTSSNLNGLVDLDKNMLDFFIDLNTLKTGIGLRDRHMRENYLETKKYPYAEFTGKIVETAFPDVGETKQVNAKGKFKIHGVEREITVPGMLSRTDANTLKLDSEFEIKLSDYNIDTPSVMFYELAEEQKVSINATFKK